MLPNNIPNYGTAYHHFRRKVPMARSNGQPAICGARCAATLAAIPSRAGISSIVKVRPPSRSAGWAILTPPRDQRPHAVHYHRYHALILILMVTNVAVPDTASAAELEQRRSPAPRLAELRVDQDSRQRFANCGRRDGVFLSQPNRVARSSRYCRRGAL
jgi:hypothetical protein